MASAIAILTPPRGPYYVFASLSAAQAAQSRVDAALGYPKAGVFAAPGPFQPATPFVTPTYSELLAHPTQQLWAYPSVPAIDQALVGATAVPVPGALTNDWGGATVVAASVQQVLAAQRTPSLRVLAGLAAVAAAGIVAAAALGPSGTASPTVDDAGALDAADAGEDSAE